MRPLNIPFPIPILVLFAVLHPSSGFTVEDGQSLEEQSAQPLLPSDLPLPTLKPIPTPPALAHCHTGSTPALIKAYENGVSSGSGGLLALKGLFFQFDNIAGLSIKETPETLACQNLRVPQEERCCKAGFIQGLKAVYQKIEPNAPTHDPAYSNCREQFEYARGLAQKFCDPNPETGVCHQPPLITHPSCVQLGFLSEVSKISAEGKNKCPKLEAFIPQAQAIASGLTRKSSTASETPNEIDKAGNILRKVGNTLIERASARAEKKANKKAEKAQKSNSATHGENP